MDCLDDLLKELEASKLDNNNDNHFKDAYNTGIDVACGVVKRYITLRERLREGE